MDKNIIEAYSYYKKEYAPFIIFFQINNNYKAFFEDAEVLNRMLGLPIINNCVTCHSDEIFEVLSVMYQQNLSAKLISYRGETGQHEFPCISQIIQEETNDY